MSVETPDWTTIPAPVDDGASSHLVDTRMPAIALPATSGPAVDLSALPGQTVVYAFPRTGRPGVDNPDGWDMIPGARGCSPQSCAFRDHYAELRRLGAAQLFGLSTQDTAYQTEAWSRLHLPFPLLSDVALMLTNALRLPTLTVAGMVLLCRQTLIIDAGQITAVFYPVFPPDRNAADVMAWLDAHPLF